MSVISLYKFIDSDNVRERTIFDVLETARYSEEKYGKYINAPIVSKSLWTMLGDHISSSERSYTNDIDNSLYTSFRLDGHSFSKKLLPFLRRNGIIEDGYSQEFERAMKLTQMYLVKTLPNVICSFCQSDEITVITGPSKIDKNGNRTSIANNGRIQKYLSITASGASSTFALSLARDAVHRGDIHEFELIPAIEFDCRIAQYDSFESALQLILWRSYDCSVNGISSGIHLNSFPNKKSLDRHNSTMKLKFLHENGFLESMTDHQLYGTFVWKQCIVRKVEVLEQSQELDENSDQKLESQEKEIKEVERKEVKFVNVSTQVLNIIKNSFRLENDYYLKVYV